MDDVDNRAVIAAWATATDHLADFGAEGDFTRQHLLNPAIFALLGPVEGHTILDAGCGQGYLCRLLAKRGALVTGVEPATPWYQAAVERERQEPLGITYLQADLSIMEALRPFDAVIANMVLMDIPAYEAAIHRCVASLAAGVNSSGGFSIFLAGEAAGFRPSTQGGKRRLHA